MVRIIVAGSREFNNYKMLNEVLSGYVSGIEKDDITIISGRATGADTLGEKFAAEHNIKCEMFPADWEKYGKEAGFIRNGEMAKFAIEDGSHGVLFAFWDGRSNGTKDMINKATANDIEKHIIVYKVNDKDEQELLFETDTLDMGFFENLEKIKEAMNPPTEDLDSEKEESSDDSSND
jgi:hypothetical protein